MRNVFNIFIIVLGIFLITNICYAGGITTGAGGEIGNVGDILTYIDHNGNSSIGEWQNPDFLKGEKGATGDTGATGQVGESGSAGQDGLNGQAGATGEQGKEGEKGTTGAKGETGKGLKNRTEIQYEGVLKSWKRAELSVYGGYDFSNENTFVGAKVKHYWGKSWAETQLDEVNKRLDRLEASNLSNAEFYTTPTGFGIREQE